MAARGHRERLWHDQSGDGRDRPEAETLATVSNLSHHNEVTASACNNLSDSITEIVRLEQFDYSNQKQNAGLNGEYGLPAPSLVFARETYTPYYLPLCHSLFSFTLLDLCRIYKVPFLFDMKGDSFNGQHF